MNVLVVNCGSSSLKAAIVDHTSGRRLAEAKVERVDSHEVALRDALPRLVAQMPVGQRISAVGHRVVHGGERFTAPTRIDDAVEAAIEALSPLAPLHNPPNLAGIRAARRLLPDVPHVAVFDTAFHATLPNRARRYALPVELAEKHGVRRYGFHGTSHQYVAERAAEHLCADVRDLRLITCHLGNGASICAVEYGRSIETSMGMTPLEGLVMGTRGGDLDPGVLLHLARAENLDVDGLDDLLNRRSGLLGLTGTNDLRDIEERASKGDEAARLAIAVFAHRVRKYIGAYAAVLGGADAIVFTAGIGENSALMRHRVASRLEFLGARLDEDANRDAKATEDRPVVDVSDGGRCKLLVVRTDEEHAIARDTASVALERDRVGGEKPIPIAISARHVHLSQEDVDVLFGKGHQLTPRTPLSQPGQFACVETVGLVGPKRQLDNVRIIGPVRKQSQVEISRTDEFHLGLDAPIRASGELANSPGITITGPAGQVTIKEGVIQSQRHIHMHPDDAVHYGVKHKDIVEVAVDTQGRDLVFGDVVVRVHPEFALEMHVDTDEGNAADLCRDAIGVLHRTEGLVRLMRKRPDASENA